MLYKNFVYYSIIVSTLVLSSCKCKQPELTGINPTSTVPRQIVAVQGNNLGLTNVQWDAGLPTQTTADASFLSPRYFQVPQGATVGSHPVRITGDGGTSANTINVNVSALSGTWPAPRIEEITYNFLSINTAENKLGAWLLIAVANIDAKAEVKINGTVQQSFLYSAIPSDYFPAHIGNTYGYPIYHYGQLLVGLSGPYIGSTIQIRVTNIDGLTAQTNFTLPSEESQADSDNDGLLDTWEINGFPAPGGTTINLQAMGCDPLHKDVLVEADWIAAAAPNNTIWDDIEAAFSNAPILNPDGSQGIAIHIDRGQGGAFTNGGTILANHTTMDFAPTGGAGYTSFFTYKSNSANFDPARLNIFHYCIFGRAMPAGNSGRGEIWGNDFQVTFVNFSNWGNDIDEIGTFIHELGHNLGLRHGGIDNTAADANETFKPNQESTMNYRYQFPGVSLDCNFTSDNVHTYSRGMRNTINEQNVNEPAGICDNIGIDFNGNGVLSSGVVVNTNIGGDTDNTDMHLNYNEWGNLKLNFRATGSRWNSN